LRAVYPQLRCDEVKSFERRRFVRINVPLKLMIKSGKRREKGITKNISPVGLRFETSKKLEDSGKVELVLYLPSMVNPIAFKARVVWQKKKSLEDKAPYDVGVEIVSIDDNDKNVFLKYLCDLFYNSTYK